MSLTGRTLKGVLWISTGTAAQSLAQFAVILILARLLTPAEFGLVGAAAVVIGFSQIFSQLGVGPAIVQMKVLDGNRIQTAFTLSFLFSLVMAVLVFALSEVFGRFFGISGLAEVIRILCVTFPISGLAAVAMARFQREMNFRAIAAINFASYLFGYGSVATILALLDFGVYALVYGQITQGILALALYLAWKPQSLGVRFRWDEARDLLSFGSGFSIARIANYFAGQGDNIVVGRMLGAEALGMYGRAYRFFSLPAGLIGGTIEKVLFPAMSSIQDDHERLNRAMIRSISTIAMLTMPLSAFLVVTAPVIIPLLLGPQWHAAIVPFQFMVVVLVFRTAYKIFHSLAKAKGAVFKRAYLEMVYAGMIILCAAVGATHGIDGVAAAIAVAVFLNFFFLSLLAKRLTNLRLSLVWLSLLRYFPQSLFVAVLAWLASQGALAIGAGDFLQVVSAAILCAGVAACLYWLSPASIAPDLSWFVQLARSRRASLARRVSGIEEVTVVSPVLDAKQP